MDPCILPVTPGSLSDADRESLRAVGVIVIEHNSPSKLRLLRPTSDIEHGDMLSCAMKALISNPKNYGHVQLQEFGALMARLVIDGDKEPQA